MSDYVFQSTIATPTWIRVPARILSRALGLIAVLVFVFLTLDVLLGVFSRYVVGTQVRWTEEMATFLLVWLAFLGASIAYLEDAHLGIDLLISKMTPELRRLALRMVHAAVLIFVLFVLVYGGGLLTTERWDAGQMMPTLDIRKAWLYMAAPANGLIIALFAVAKIVSPVAELTDAQESGE